MKRTMAALVAVLVIAGCGEPGESGADETTSTSSPPTTSTPDTRDTTPVTPPGDTVPPTNPPVTGEAPDEVMEAVLEDLRGRLDDPDAEVEVIRDESVTWPDGSLGCAEPGQMYTQALIEGYHIELAAEGQTYDYRVGSETNFKLCETPLRPGG